MTTINRYNSWKRFRIYACMLFVGISILLFGVHDMAAGQSNSNVEDDSLLAQALSNQYESNENLMSITFMNVSLEEALEILAERLRVGFSYNPDIMPEKWVNFSLANVPAHVIIYKLLEGTNLEPVLPPSRDVIILKEKGAVLDFDIIQDVVRGTVADAQTGESLPGVNIFIEGTTIGTTTNMSGEFELGVPSLEETLVFSYIGYQRLVMNMDGRNEIYVELLTDVQMLDDVVVVGFGQTQRVENLTGSVAAISARTIQDRPLTQSSQALAGAMSGVTVLQSSGNPGADHAIIRIRGLNTFSGAGNSPLVLVDGIASSINDVSPSDIESVTILKDAASAAIYGSRGANGVILVETKKGHSGELQVDYDTYTGLTRPTQLLDLVDAATWAEMQNEANINQGQSPGFSQEDINKFRSGEDPENYPNLDQYRLLMDSRNPIQTNHNFRISGGSQSNRYSLSLGYLNKEGLMLNNDFERYNARFNLDSRINDKLSINLNLSGYESDHKQLASPGQQGRNSPNGLIQTSIKIPPTIGGQKSDGTYGRLADFTIPGWLASDSERKLNNQFLLGIVGLNYNFSEDFNMNLTASKSNKVGAVKLFQGEVVLDPNVTLGPSELTESRAEENLLTLQSTFGYAKDINIHSIRLLGGFSQEQFRSKFVQASRDNFPNNFVRELNAGDIANQQAIGTSAEWAIQSIFGRFNYILNDRYLLESNVRYDGSSRFPKENRFGLFPSVSLGWRIAEEDFFTIDWIDEFKIRGSLGQIGNQEVGFYPYQLTLNLGVNTVWGDSFIPGAAANLLPNRDIKWETTTTLNFGLDFEIFNNRIRGTIEYFDKETEDILYNVSTSAVLGLTPSEQNAASVKNTGFEFSINYRDYIGDFFFSISPNFSIVNNEVTSLAGLERDIGQGLFVGQPIQSIYGFVADGLFIDQNDIDTWPKMPYPVRPGDIRLKDLNGDGMVTFENDRKIIGNRFPKYNFGMNLNGGYRSIDFNIQLHGVAGINDVHNSGEAFRAFWLGTTPQKWQIENRFRPDNPSRDAKYPLLENVSSGDRNAQVSTYWLRDAWFMRVRDITIGYTLPVDIIERIGFRNLRIYLNGNNLFTFDSFFDGWEPEMSGFYPLTKSYNLGVNVQF